MSFDNYASDYDHHLETGIGLSGEGKEFFARGRLMAVRDFFLRSSVEPRRILEFGCGVGTNLSIIKEVWPASDLVGIDRSKASLAIGRDRLKGTGVRLLTPEENCQGREAPFDWVFCNGVFHHIPSAERDSALRFIRDRLRPGGVLTLFENNPFNPGTHLVMWRIPFDRGARMINPYRLKSGLRSLGFEPVFCRFLFVFPRLLSPLRALEPYLVRLPFGAQYGLFAVRGRV